MPGRTIAVGDVHGDLGSLLRLLGRLPRLGPGDTLLFLGDYVDRGPHSARVVDLLRRELPSRTAARVLLLRGNHEDGWLRVRSRGWPEFVVPQGNGCRECARSYLGPEPERGGEDARRWLESLMTGSFLPGEVVDWMESLPFWHEDEHAIYVHGGLVGRGGAFLHPRELEAPSEMLWTRSEEFFAAYRGKGVVCGHTLTACLPQGLSRYTPEDPNDLWAGLHVMGLDTGAGKPGGFLSALELPAMHVYESR